MITLAIEDMDLQLIWHKPVELKEASATSDLIYEIDLEKIPKTSGVYIFMRHYGDNRYPLYIGKARNLKIRIKQHLNRVTLMKQIKKEPKGSRTVVFAEFIARPGQNTPNCISLIEKTLIRHFLSEGNDLLNIAGARIAKHTLTSKKVAGRFLPNKILFE